MSQPYGMRLNASGCEIGFPMIVLTATISIGRSDVLVCNKTLIFFDWPASSDYLQINLLIESPPMFQLCSIVVEVYRST